jgi:hypothetical protein
MQRWFYSAATLTAISLAGCGAQLSKADLGTVVFEVPKVAGSDEPYRMPQLDPAEAEKGEKTKPE